MRTLRAKHGDRYEQLEDTVVRTLRALPVERFLSHKSPQVRYIGQRTRALRELSGDRAHWATELDDIAVIVALRRLVDQAEQILPGQLSGMACVSATPGLWKRMMCEWPMGDYGLAVAEYINSHGLVRGRIVELGAGVGHASCHINAAAATAYIKTDLNKAILRMYNPGGVLEAFNIDTEAAPYQDIDLVFASNVLHCAARKASTLTMIYRMLAPGGDLVFTEGTPEVQPGRPWCLSPLFGFFDGWWDRGGFIPFEQWQALLSTAGFSVVKQVALECGLHHVGNLIACRKPRTSN